MREVELYVPFEAATTLGLDPSPDGFESATVADVTIIAFDGPESLAAVTYSNPDETELENALDDAAHVKSWELLGRDGTNVTYLCETNLQASSAASGADAEETLDVQTVTVDDGGWTLELVGDQAALQCAITAGVSENQPITLRRLTEYEGPTAELDALTPKQREVLETAHDLGYYEVPREGSADEVATELDLDRSTVTEHLRRAERNLLSALLSG